MIALLLFLAVVVGAPVALALTLNWFQFGRLTVDHHGELGAFALPAPEARVLHPVRLPLLRAAFTLVLLLLLAIPVVLLRLVPFFAALGAALPLALGAIPLTWSERRFAHDPRRAQQITLPLATAVAVLAIVNAMALDRGGGPDAWLAFLQRRLEEPGESLAGLVLLGVPALLAWGVPCSVVTDVRVRIGASRQVAVFLAMFVLGAGLVSLAILEVAYRLAALVDERLGAEDEGAAPG